MKALILILTAALAACNDTGPDAVVAPAEHIYSVSEFLDKPELREKVGAACSNDPGRLGKTPNCINVLQAMRVASAGGTKGFPRIVP